MISIRFIGITLIIVGIAVLGLTYRFKLQEDKHLEQLSFGNGTCVVNGECVHEGRSFTLYIISGFLGLFVVFTGILFGFFQQQVVHAQQVIAPVPRSQLKEIDTSQFNEDEQKVYQYLKGHQGSAFQSELVRELGTTKVRITRVLDRLEGLDVLERKRRGMTNIVVLR